jgi:hypothetical protein
MPATDKAKEIKKLTATANDASKSPDVRLLAARKLLRETNHSARSVRVAKRVARLYFADENQTSTVRKRAASLLEFTISAHESDEEINAAETAECLQPQPFLDMFAKKPEPPKKTHAEQLMEKNEGWNTYKYNPYLRIDLPAQWIFYRSLADLEQYGIPTDPRFVLTGHLFDTFKIVREDGQVFYMTKGLWWDELSNPAYIAALDGRHENWSCVAIDSIDENGQIVKNTDGNKY